MQPCTDDGLAYRMRGPRHLIGEPTARRQLMGGVIEVLPLIPNRPRAKPAIMFRAIIRRWQAELRLARRRRRARAA